MARFADFFTNGGYSKALAERDAIASRSVGNTGYSNAQTLAMRLANDLSRGRNAELQGQTMAENIPLGQRIAMAAQQNITQPADYYDYISSLQDAGVKTANQRVAQQQANAMNAQERIGQGIESNLAGAKTGFKVGMLANDGSTNTSYKVAPPDPNDARTIAQNNAQNKVYNEDFFDPNRR